MSLTDRYNRPLLNLRIAITRRCNLKCTYCHREGEESQTAKTEEMTASEIVRIAKVAVNLGISRIKLTGGEPLMRKDLNEIVGGIAAIPGLNDLSMTTNGTLLSDVASELRICGLKRVNISLPTLKAEVYSKLTRGNVWDAVRGVKAAVDAGFNPVKLNMVVLKDVNVEEIHEMMDFARANGVTLQLIELDPVNVEESYYSVSHYQLSEYERMFEQKALAVHTRRFMHNRRVYMLPDVTVEVVHPIENSEFCMHCTRLRVTSDGKLKPCLMRNDNLVDVLTPMRHGASDAELKALFFQANGNRRPYYSSVNAPTS
jgi:cyclic pyranopterin phosphate synthase